VRRRLPSPLTGGGPSAEERMVGEARFCSATAAPSVTRAAAGDTSLGGRDYPFAFTKARTAAMTWSWSSSVR
jgi:hypothetical protein